MKLQAKRFIIAGLSLALFGFSPAANAVDINIYGASAQYDFWNDAADNFLIDIGGCSGVLQGATSPNGATVGSACANWAGSPSVTIRYSSKASYDGIWASQGQEDTDNCDAGDDDTNLRLMRTSNSNAALACYPVTLGASDVAGDSFVQKSHGYAYGPFAPPWLDFDFSGIEAPTPTAQPLVVPFGFFVNKAVKARHCKDTLAAGFEYRQGEWCTADSQCDGTTGSCEATSKTITNITRMMITSIYSGGVQKWTDFGSYFDNKDIVACLRHAGSGTHATLQYAVMEGNGWGPSTLLDTQDDDGTSEASGGNGERLTYFNQGTGEMINCVNGDDGNSGTPFSNTTWGAIGYADADRSISSKPNVYGPIKFDGASPLRWNLRNGKYTFYSVINLYESADVTDAQREILDALYAFAADPTRIPGTKANFWATAAEMKFFKSTDKEYPSYQGGTVGGIDPLVP
ncbi:MAG: hypothetical protein AB9873_12620 [Syntrophobacteraceae bacterium]